ncbi:MAG: hypothetical protein RR035_06920 [Oscillibacter sp.]
MSGRNKTPKPEQYAEQRVYDYSTPESRQATASWLFAEAKGARTVKESEWTRHNDYYNFIHEVTDEGRESARERGIDWDAAVIPDPFIMVESQIDPVVPEPQFTGRDSAEDDEKAREREYTVKYICQENRLEDMNTANERRLKKLGDAFWKAYWDSDMDCGPYEGNIRVRDVPVESIYVDPSAGADGIQAGQYVDYVYRVHKIRFWQIYHRALEKQGIGLEDIISCTYKERGGIFDMASNSAADDDTIQVLEHWFKQPFDTKDAPAGAVGCTVQAGGHEIKYIPQYWQKTGRQNQLYPFVHYWCIRDENEFYNKSELMPIMALTDGADRALANAMQNDDLTSNDIIMVEEGAMAEGEEFSNEPGAKVVMKQNCIDKARRLGGLHDGKNGLPMISWFQGQIERANRNYDSNNGKETARVTTASGLAQLRGDADDQRKIKKADRNAGFMRLYELLDWLALEFFDDNRLIYLGAKDGQEEAPEPFDFNSQNYAVQMPAVLDAATGETVRSAYQYFPRVDVTVSAGDGVIRSKAATLEVLDKLASIPVTADNYKLLEAELEILDIPQKQQIVDIWDKKFEGAVPPELIAALEQNPELLQSLMGAVGQMGAPEGAEVMGM